MVFVIISDTCNGDFSDKLLNWVSESHNFPDMMMTDREDYLSKNNDRKSAKEGKNLYKSGLQLFPPVFDQGLHWVHTYYFALPSACPL